MNFIKHFISICLPMKQCSRVGIPLEQSPFTYKGTTFGGGKRANDFKTLSLNETTHSLGLHVYPLEDEDFPIVWYLQVTDRCWWDFRTVITLLNVSDLNKILLEKNINIINTLTLSCSWSLIASFLGIDYWHLSAVIKQIHWIILNPTTWNLPSLHGRLRAPVTKQRS